MGLALKDNPSSISYTKTDKLIMALYMVTDIMDSSDPIRLKLRALGADILSDTYASPLNAVGKIKQVVSFLDIALTVSLVSEMNANILKNEFSKLQDSIEALSQEIESSRPREVDLSDFFATHLSETERTLKDTKRTALPDKVHSRIGVQKGSTLMKALSKMQMSDSNSGMSVKKSPKNQSANYEALKSERRQEIKDIVHKNANGATITDIKNFAYGSLIDCGEKTLQRELVSMVKDNILTKTGEKRWSRYFVK